LEELGDLNGDLIEFNSSLDLSNKIKISPIGKSIGTDGRVFEIDNSVVENTNELHHDIVLNINHGFDTSYGDSAGGWFKEFENKDDGIYAKLELNEVGKKLVDQKLYRYFSPEFKVSRNYENNIITVKKIVGVALVNKPNLKTDSFNKIQKQEKNKENIVDKTKHEEQINSLKQESVAKDKLIAKLTEENNSLRVDLAVQKNQITPAQVDFAKSLDSEHFEKYIESNKINMQNLAQDTKIETESNSSSKYTQEELNVFEEMGVEI
jgi:phage I-like protein